MNPVLKEILETGLSSTPSGENVRVHSQISQKEGEFLQYLISLCNPKETLEIGLAYGVSALYICDKLEKTPETRHIIIDPNQYGGSWGDNWNGVGIHNLKKAGYEKIIKHVGLPSYQALPQLEKDGQKVDFAFIDGWHTFDHAFIDFFYTDKMLKVGGIVAFDDASWPSIHKLCRYIRTNLSYSVIVNPNLSKPVYSKKRKALKVISELPIISKRNEEIFKPEILTDDLELDLFGSLIAFRKDSEDARSWDFHREF